MLSLLSVVIKGAGFLSDVVSVSFEMMQWYFFKKKILSVGCVALIDFHILNQTCIPGINPLWWVIFFICYWIQFASILLRTFVPMVTRDIGL